MSSHTTNYGGISTRTATPKIMGYFSDKGSFYMTNGQTYECKEPFVIPPEAKREMDKRLNEFIAWQISAPHYC